MVSKARARDAAGACRRPYGTPAWWWANGYSHPAVKIFMTRDGKTVEHHYIEHYPPDPPQHDLLFEEQAPRSLARLQNIEAEMGHYVIGETKPQQAGSMLGSGTWDRLR